MCINSFSCPTDKFVSEILTLLRPNVELAPNTDSFVILSHSFDTYRTLLSLLQLHSTDIQILTLFTIHVNNFPRTISSNVKQFYSKLLLNLLHLNSLPFSPSFSPLFLILFPLGYTFSITHHSKKSSKIIISHKNSSFEIYKKNCKSLLCQLFASSKLSPITIKNC